jgi:hypothetical protein
LAIAEAQECAEEFLIHHFKTDRTRINCTQVDVEHMLTKGRFAEQDQTEWDFEIVGRQGTVFSVKLNRVMWKNEG